MGWNVEIPDAESYVLGDPGIESVIREIRAAKLAGIDTETTGLNVMRAMPVFWSLAVNNRRICMPSETLPLFREVFEDSSIDWVLHNAKFDAHMLANVGITLRGRWFDTAVMHALLYEEESHRLKDLAKKKLGWGWSSFKDTFNISDESRTGEVLLATWSVDRQRVVEYAANDAFGTLALFHVLRRELEEEIIFSLYPDEYPNMWELYKKTELPFTKVLWTCERNGIRVNTDYLKDIETPVKKELLDIHKEIVRQVGFDLNPRSHVHVRDLCLNKLGLRPRRMTKGGKSGVKTPSVDAEFLEEHDDIDIIKLILRYRDLDKLLGTYVLGLPDKLGPDGRIHPRFNQDVARTGRLSSSDPNCFHPDTEFLTRQGWVRCADLQEGADIAEYRPDGTVAFVQPTAYYRQQATELVSIRNQHTRLLVTEDHRCLLRHRKTGELRVFSAASYPEDWEQIHAGVYDGAKQSSIPEHPAFLQLLIAVQADGTYEPEGAIAFAFKKKRKAARLFDILNELGVRYTAQVDSYGRTRIRLPRQDGVESIRAIMPDKAFGPWVLGLTRQQLDIFYEEVFHWDGSWTRRNSYASNDSRNTAWVQLVFALSGHRAHWRVYQGKKNLSYQVDVTERDYSLTTNIEKTRVPYSGDVYCVSVPSTYVLTRLEGEISVTGQCQNIPNADNDRHKIRRAFEAEKGNALIVADYSALEMRLLAVAAGEQDMIQIFLDGKDIHMGNASLVFGLPYEDIVKAKKLDKAIKEEEERVKKGATRETLTKLTKEMEGHYHDCLLARGYAKTIGFGLNYGMKANKLARGIGKSVEEAQLLMEQYMERYPAVRHFYDSAIAETKETLKSFTVLGRRRFLPEITSMNSLDRWGAERKAVNNQIQGSAADLVRMAMLNAHASDLYDQHECHMLMQVHDELVFECPESEVDICMGKIKHIMEHPFPTDLSVPFEVSIGKGSNWLDAK